MIFYNEVHYLVSRRLGNPDSGSQFDKDGKLTLVSAFIDGKVLIQSGRIVLREDSIQLVVWYEVSRLPVDVEGDTIEKKANILFANHCLGLKLKFTQKKARQFFCLYLSVNLPHPTIQEKLLDTSTAKDILKDFLDDCVGYAPLWMDKKDTVDYVSKCATQLAKGKSYFYPSFESKLEDYFSSPGDDFSGLENLII